MSAAALTVKARRGFLADVELDDVGGEKAMKPASGPP